MILFTETIMWDDEGCENKKYPVTTFAITRSPTSVTAQEACCIGISKISNQYFFLFFYMVCKVQSICPMEKWLNMLLLYLFRGNTELSKIPCAFSYSTGACQDCKTTSVMFWCTNRCVPAPLLTKTAIDSKPAESISICKYSMSCRSYISAMFAFVAMATDVWPSQIISGTQWLTPAHAHSVHATQTWQH